MSILALVLLAAWAGSEAIPHVPPETCAVTRPPAPAFVPPALYPAKPGGDSFWFGTEKLWVILPANGTWRGLKPYSPTVGGYRQKIFWWRQGYHWRREGERWRPDPTPPLTVTGRRLDAVAPPLPVRNGTNGCCGSLVRKGTNGHGEEWTAFMVVGVDFPTHGCWEVTGRIKDDKLTFVVLVAP